MTTELETRVNELSLFQSDQVAIGEHSPAHIEELGHLHLSNCAFQDLPYELPASFNAVDDIADFRPALLQFMIAATPKGEVVNDILSNYDSYINEMTGTPTSHFASSSDSIEFLVDSVPDTVNPVKAKMAYIQVPNKKGDATHLNLVWKASP